MADITFANPAFFYLFLLFIPIVSWYTWKRNDLYAVIQVSSTASFEKAPKTYKYYLEHFPIAMRLLVIASIIVALARPQSTSNWENVTTEGIDIVLTLDISSSMLAEDFRPNRIEAAKDVASEFIAGRRNDRIGLVVFSGESFTQCPLTTDHAVLLNLFKDIQSGMIEDGTAIGLGLANAVSRIKDSKSMSKVIILLTDGVNNMGQIAPVTAAEIAHTFGIRVYTIGVGTIGTAPMPFKTVFGIQYQNVPVEIDEDVMRQIAQMTDGKYFRATNNQKLKEIYKEIDKLEKSKIDVKKYSRKQEHFWIFILIASLLLVVEILLRYVVLRRIP